MKIPTIEDIDVAEKRVIVRADLDVASEELRTKSEEYDSRLVNLIPTLEYLIKAKAKIVIIGHRGRPSAAKAMEGKPEGKEMPELSLKPVAKLIEKLLTDKLGKEGMVGVDLQMMENLRFNPSEEANDIDYAKDLAEHGDVYINESFAVSHREHASIVALPKIIKKRGGQVAIGLKFAEEVKNLSKVLNKPEHPVITIIGGVKKDKLQYIDALEQISDRVLIGGRLPEHIGEESEIRIREKIIVGKLNQDKEDITLKTAELFEQHINKAKTVVFAGPMGKYEDGGQALGTKRVLQAIADTDAFKVAGGGDSTTAINQLGFEMAFDWISVGGGAMLEYLTHTSLPGIDALVD